MRESKTTEDAIMILEKLLEDVKASMVIKWEYEAEQDKLSICGRRSHSFKIEYVKI